MAAPAHLGWLAATATALRDETATVRTVMFDVPGWPGHVAGQHVDVRLTAEDGYQAERSYSIASSAGAVSTIELTIERIDEGEVSPFLTRELAVGEAIELRGPIGGYFTWEPESTAPLMLVAGGSGVVPLMSMLRTRLQLGKRVPARLLYSSRRVESIIYAHELDHFVAQRDGFSLTHTLTRATPAHWQGEIGRVDRQMLAAQSFFPETGPRVFVCGPTSFVETVVDHLVSLGHAESAIRTERFGPTGEKV